MPGMTKAGYKPDSQKSYNPKPGSEPGKPKKKKKRKSRMSRAAVASLLVFAAAVAIGALTLHVFAQVERYANVFSLGEMLSGHPIGGMTAAEGERLLDELTQEAVTSWRYEITCQGRQYALTAADIGLYVDKKATLEPLWLVGKQGSILDRYMEMLRVQAERMLAEPVIGYAMEPVDLLLQQIKEETDCGTVDATVSYSPGSSTPFRFTDEQTGYALETEALRGEIERSILSLEPGSTELTPDAIEPAVTRKALENAITLRARVTLTLDGDEAALENVRIAAGVLNGQRISAGETFSFNEAVGRRTQEGGYQEAPEPAYGVGVKGFGGGVCQVSSALYQAALLAGVKVEQRSAAVRPVAYCDMGLEAAVSDQGLDLVICNPTDSPLFVTTRVYPADDGGWKLEMQLIGAPLQGRYELTAMPLEIGTVEEPVYMVDKTGEYAVYSDERVPVSEAQPGYSVVVTRAFVSDLGERGAEETISEDVYEPIAPLVYVGAQER